ncbi:PDR/VanB family oxidoreductase [Leucobacter sp. W1038]|uniref:PDR/VanB family oxidoreductase n=1 Tax=Leucobacter sp. W1038 TaxID=3438281 RepID=UPI003D99C35D
MADKQTAWQDATVVATRRVAEGIQRIELAPKLPVPVKPGTHVDIEVHVTDRVDLRSYSIVDASESGDTFALSVYRSPVSRGGAEYMHSLRPGDRVRVTQPLQDFPFRVGAPSYTLVAGGVGITAMLGMARVLRKLGAEYELHYVGHSRERMAYLDELGDEHGERLIPHITQEHGRMQVADLIAEVPPAAELYMCGPIRLMEEIRRLWDRGGRDRTLLRSETFGNSGWFDAQPFVVEVPQYGARVDVRADESMLEALERSGVDMMFDCRRGECGLCEVRILDLSGAVDHRDVFYSERQKAPNSKLCCCVSRVVASGDPALSSGEALAAASAEDPGGSAAQYRPTGRGARIVIEVS